MKKIVALLITIATVTTAIAQSSKIEEARRIINGESRTTHPDDRRVYGDNDDRYSSREAEIDRINREYDRRIASIRNNPFLSAAEKERRIRDLQYERERRIREINGRYSRDNRRYDDDSRYSKKAKGYKKDNGRHLGWEKGVGNPHRTGNWPSEGKGKGNGKGRGKGKG